MTFGEYAIAHDDVLTALRALPDASFDGALFDPPYGFKFMNKAWDYDVPSVEVFTELLRVLKPGAPLLSFGGARTFHRVACNIEDAGAELRDCLCWLYGKGFPKSQNVSLAIDKAAGATRKVVGTRKLTGNAAISTAEKGGTYGVQVGSVPAKTVDVTAPATLLAQQWDGYGTALKPAWEPILLGRKQLDTTMAENISQYGCGPLAINACRIGLEGGTRKPDDFVKAKSDNAYGDGLNSKGWLVPEPIDAGRWPANLLLDEDAAGILDAQVGTIKSRKSITRNGGGNQGGPVFDKRTSKAKPDGGYTDEGGPSRFFYCAKVSTREREFGCDALPKRSAGEATGGREEGSAGLSCPRAGAGRTSGARNHHPTLKPIALTRWLASLIKPPTEGATLLVPYSGAGSEMIGALQAGWPCVFGIEGDADYVEIAHARIAAWSKVAA
jgi:hypothetical protein